MSNYLENKIVDYLFRGQPYTPPTNTYVGLLTSAPTDVGGGNEVSTVGTNYSRAMVANSLVNWAGTQAPGSTVASTGTTGTTSNNASIDFATPSDTWGTVTHVGLYDAPTGGNLLFFSTLLVPKTVNTGDAVSFTAGSLSVQIDN